MLLIFALFLAVIFSYTCRKALKKHAVVFYAAAAVISIAVTIFDFHGVQNGIVNGIISLFSRGAFATALWCVIMWIGALPNGSAPMKTWMPIRGELSILAAILTLGHNFGYGKTYFVRMFSNPQSMKPTHLTAGILSLIMLFIMIPLTILSIPSIRKKMSAKLWKKIQRLAYLFYTLIYVHVMVLFLPLAQSGKTDYIINVIVYSLLFISYAFCRIYKEICKKKPEYKYVVSRLSGLGVVLCMVCVVILMSPVKKDDNAVLSLPTYTVSDTTPMETAEETIASSSEMIETSTITEDIPAQKPLRLYKDGTYTASAFGYDGDITVDVTILNDHITAITAKTAEEDSWYFEQAEKSIIEAILINQNTEVDAVSGATYSSRGIMQAVKNALEHAKNVEN
ncbi:MAG: FMN-binding protein [Clostridia bacterium]|nr:FMN-binding protein [Clostridia bacterium]